jgi:hypothetical protein
MQRAENAAAFFPFSLPPPRTKRCHQGDIMNVRVLIGFLAGASIAAIGTYWLTLRESAPPVAIEISPPAPPTTVESPGTPRDPAAETPALKPVAKKPEPARAKAAPRPSPKPLVIAHHLPPFNDRPVPAPIEIAAARPQVQAIPKPVAPTQQEPVKLPEPPQPNTVTITPGTSIPVRLAQHLSTSKNRPGDIFTATLDQELIVDGFVIAEKGSRTEGRIAAVEEAGRLRGLSHLAVELTRLHTSDGQTVRIHTARVEKLGPQTHREDAELPLEAVVTFRLDQPITITEKLH